MNKSARRSTVATLIAAVSTLTVVREVEGNLRSPSTTCLWSPSSSVEIEVGASETFNAFSCLDASGYTATLSKIDGTAGFTRGDGCELFEVVTDSSAGTFKVEGCEIGEVVVTILDPSMNYVQSIDIEIIPAT